MKRICRHLRVTKDNGLVFNPSKKLVVDCYADADFAGMWGNGDPKTRFVLGVELDLW